MLHMKRFKILNQTIPKESYSKYKQTSIRGVWNSTHSSKNSRWCSKPRTEIPLINWKPQSMQYIKTQLYLC